jgi:hypothetical protein
MLLGVLFGDLIFVFADWLSRQRTAIPKQQGAECCERHLQRQALCIYEVSRILLRRALGLLTGTIVTCKAILVGRISGHLVYGAPN